MRSRPRGAFVLRDLMYSDGALGMKAKKHSVETLLGKPAVAPCARHTSPIGWMQLFCAVLFVASSLQAAEQPKPGKVTLAVPGNGGTLVGWPVIVELTLTNNGTEPIDWWCLGPGLYPTAEHFTVQIRSGGNNEWHDVRPTNGQYIQGSFGAKRQLKPGESIAIPLAIPLPLSAQKDGGVTFRILPRFWHTDTPAEGFRQIVDDPGETDRLRAKVIMAALAQKPPFLQHLAMKYADDVVIDALLKLVTVDNAKIVSATATVLARQNSLPERAGNDFAVAVRRWLPRSPQPEWGGLREYVAEAALKTQSEAARGAVLEVLQNASELRCKLIAIDALRLSPGDHDWLRRARLSINAAQRASPMDVELSRFAELATKWLDNRLRQPNPKPPSMTSLKVG